MRKLIYIIMIMVVAIFFATGFILWYDVKDCKYYDLMERVCIQIKSKKRG